MTNTVSFVVLWALMKAVRATLPRAPRRPHADDCGCTNLFHRDGWDSERRVEEARWNVSLGPIWSDAREELERLDLPPDRCACGREAAEAIGDPFHDHTPECVVWLKARLAQLEEALLLARNVVRHAQMADPTHVEEYQEIEARCDAALEGRDA